MHSTIYVGNTSIIQLDELANQDGTYQNDATVTLQSLTDKASGTAVSGVTVPLSMSYVAASDGKYQGTIAHGAGLTAGKVYLATVRAVSASGQRAEWVETVIAKERVD